MKGSKANVKCERINDNVLSAQEYASGGVRKNKSNNIRDEDDESVADTMIELQRGANTELDRKSLSTSFSHKQIEPVSCGESEGLVKDGHRVEIYLRTEGGT